MTKSLINHVLLQGELPPFNPEYLYEFIHAGNGVFVRAQRPEMEAMIPLAQQDVRGLRIAEPYVNLTHGPVPAARLEFALELFFRRLPEEDLIWMTGSEGQWACLEPPQQRSRFEVEAADPFHPEREKALVHLHSHGLGAAFFSRQDDEANREDGFHVFAVVGRVGLRPVILTRIGIYGYFWEVPAATCFEMPAGLADLLDPQGEPLLREAAWTATIR